MNFEVQILLKNSIAHIQAKEYDRAVELLTKARSLSPGDPDVLRFLAVVAALKYQYEDALQFIDKSIEFAPGNAIAHSNRGNILKELGRHEEALDALNTAIELHPQYAEAHNNKGNVLQGLHRYEESLACYDAAIGCAPNYSEAHNNRGNCLKLLEKYSDAFEAYDTAIELNPKFAQYYWNKAELELSLGDFESGWKNYEARWYSEHAVPASFSNIARLVSLGDVNERRILVWAEQGFGDTIQFCRYIQILAGLGARITFVVPVALLNALSTLSKYCTLVKNVSEQEQSQFHFQTPLLSLPMLFNTSLDTLPSSIPYLDCDAQKRLLFESHIKDKCCLKVGVIWSGGFRIDHPELWALYRRRNIALEQIARLQEVIGVDFYSLQKGDPAESEVFEEGPKIWPSLINHSGLLKDFSDTAAFMECLDLIISVDTSSAHLAGALGKPVWLLNRYDSCWRWLKGRSDSPWYPTMRIYQQTQPENWDEVIVRVKQDLITLSSGR